MEKESIKLEETEIKEDERIDEPVDDILDIDDILAEWEAAEGSVEPEEVPEVNEEDIEQIERKPKSPILSPDIQRMIDEIEGVILNPWNRTIMLDKYLIEIILGKTA